MPRLPATAWGHGFYELTDAGHQALELFTSEWGRFTNAVDRLLTQGGAP